MWTNPLLHQSESRLHFNSIRRTKLKFLLYKLIYFNYTVQGEKGTGKGVIELEALGKVVDASLDKLAASLDKLVDASSDTILAWDNWDTRLAWEKRSIAHFH